MTPAFEPGEQAPPPKKSMTPVLLVVLILVLGACLLGLPILAAILFPAFSQARELAVTATAATNIKNQAVAATMYSIDNDGRLPLASNVYEALRGYVKSEVIEPKMRLPFSYNKEVSGVNLDEMTNQSEVIMFYVGNDVGGISYLYRGRSVIALSDSQVKMIRSNERVTWKPTLKKKP